jgi:hypothetical protein
VCTLVDECINNVVQQWVANIVPLTRSYSKSCQPLAAAACVNCAVFVLVACSVCLTPVCFYSVWSKLLLSLVSGPEGGELLGHVAFRLASGTS